jgi:wyosine [tRNA(Phe)-imidazoG37] synthetase (radical SAM superfamily)
MDSLSSTVSRQSRLALAAKLQQRSLASVVEQVRQGEPVAAPVVVELDVTTFCDLACPECISGALLNSGRFSDQKLLTLASEIASVGVRAVILIGGGEPLLHPSVDNVIQALVTSGVAVGLTTNGTQIGRHLDVIATNVEWTRVSIDAACASTYSLFRPRRGGNRETFVEVIANVEALAKIKHGALGYSFLLIARRETSGSRVIHHNFGEVAAAAQLARDLGCDYVEFKPEYDLGHHLVPQPQELRELLGAELIKAAALQDSSFQVIAPAHLSRVVAGEPLDEPKTYHRCPSVELRTLVTPSGAYLCPYHRGNLAARYGDPTKASFTELWQSAERERAASRIDPSRDCRFSCIRHDSNEWLLHGQATTETVDDYDMFI